MLRRKSDTKQGDTKRWHESKFGSGWKGRFYGEVNVSEDVKEVSHAAV